MKNKQVTNNIEQVEKKKKMYSFKSRVLFSVLILFIFGLILASGAVINEHWFPDLLTNIQKFWISFGMVFALILVSFFIFKELNDFFFRSNNKILFSCYPIFAITQLALAFLCLNNHYEIHIILNPLTFTFMLFWIFFPLMFISGLLVWLISLIDLSYTRINNVKYYPIIFVLFSFTFFFFTYFLYIESWTSLLIIIGTVFVLDSGSYLGGSLFGKRKITPNTSPNKTLGGLVAGLSLAAIFYGAMMCVGYLTPESEQILYIYFGIQIIDVAHIASFYSDTIYSWWYIVSLIGIFALIVVLAFFGDLWFSKVKRVYQVKDFSAKLGGHGGIVDRLDSISFAVTGLGFVLVIVNFFANTSTVF